MEAEVIPAGDISVNERVNSLLSEFNSYWRQSVNGIVNAGRILIEAENEVPLVVDEFSRQCPLSDATQIKLKKITRKLSEVQQLNKLPNSWTTLYLLSDYSPSEIDQMATSGVVTPETTAADLKKLTQEPKDEYGKEEKALVSALRKIVKAEMPLHQLLMSEFTKPDEAVEFRAWLLDEVEELKHD